MATCPHCTGATIEHLTSDERIVYCDRCGWEHRETLAERRTQRFKRPEQRDPPRRR